MKTANYFSTPLKQGRGKRRKVAGKRIDPSQTSPSLPPPALFPQSCSIRSFSYRSLTSSRAESCYCPTSLIQSSNYSGRQLGCTKRLPFAQKFRQLQVQKWGPRCYRSSANGQLSRSIFVSSLQFYSHMGKFRHCQMLYISYF